jgi:hypothetical protein
MIVKRLLFGTTTLGIICCFALSCNETSSDPGHDSGTNTDSDTDTDTDSDTDTDTDSDTDTDTDGDKECVPAECCHATSCVEKAQAPDCTNIGCTEECAWGTMDCGQGFCEYIDGQCTAVIVADLFCDERIQKSHADINSVLGDNLSCQGSEDCTTVDVGTGCQGACPVAVAKSGVKAVTGAVGNANHKYCLTYQEDDCLFSTPDCADRIAICENKKCV